MGLVENLASHFVDSGMRSTFASKAARKSAPGTTSRREFDRSLTPLHRAAIGGKVMILEVVLRRKGVDIEKKDSRLRTPLHHAVINGRLGAVELLLAHGASVAAEDDASLTPLTVAVQYGRLEIMKILLENGASVSAKCSDACTPLHYAAIHGRVEIAKILLENGASPQGRDKKRCTALDYAVYDQHWELVELLLKEGRRRWVSSQSQPQDEDNHPAATIDDDEALLSVLKKETETDRQTPLDVAARLGRDDLVRRLFNEHGCHPRGAKWSGTIPLYLAVERGHKGCVEVLVSCGADVDDVGSGHETPLRCALRLGHDMIADILLDARANSLDRMFTDIQYQIVALLAMLEPSVAAQLLSRVPSLDSLSICLVEVAKFKHVGIVQEYFRVFAPMVGNKYANQLVPVPPPIAKLVQHLIQGRGTLATAPTAANSTSHSLDIQRTIVAALRDRFVGVFFLLSLVEPEILSKVLASVPGIREEAGWMLPSRLNRQKDEELITCLSKAGYTLPTLPLRPRSTLSKRNFHHICEAGSTTEVRRRLQAGGEDVNAAGLRNRTPLHMAAQRGHLEIVKLLVDYGADLTATTFFGSTAEKLAEKFHQSTVAAFLKTAREAAESAGTAESSASQQEPRVEQDQTLRPTE